MRNSFCGLLKLGIFSILLLGITSAHGQSACLESNSIATSRWHLIGLSCDVGIQDTVEDVFGDDFSPLEYGQKWVLYQHNTSDDSFSPLDINSKLRQGIGYWIFTVIESTYDIEGSFASVVSKVDSPECPSNAGCFEIELVEPLDGQLNQFNLVSHPLIEDVAWADVCIGDGSTSYSPSQAASANFMAKEIYKYNGNAFETFDDVTLGLLGELNVHDGFWVNTLEGAVDKELTLLIPAGPKSDPCGNLPPVVDEIADQQIQAGSVFRLQSNATDPDPTDQLSYALTNSPSGMNINSSNIDGFIEWQSSLEDSGANAVTVRATDPLGLFDEESFILTVLGGANRAPNLIPPGDRTLVAGTNFTSPLFAADPDIGDTLTFSLLQAPQGMTVNAQSGMLLWDPSTQDIGVITVNAMVQDAGGLVDTEQFEISIIESIAAPIDNGLPELSVPDNTTISVADQLALQAAAVDPDQGANLVFSLINGPSGLQIDSVSGAITWQPLANDIGAHDVSIKVTDQFGAIDIGSFLITVVALNQPPVARDDAYQINFGETLNVDAAGVLENDSDPNNDDLTAMLVDPAQRGNVALNPDGSFVYQAGGFGGVVREDINLAYLSAPSINVSSSFSDDFLPERAVDDDLDTSWFTARPDPLAPNGFIELVFTTPVTVKELQLVGNREFQTGFDFLSGKFELFDGADNLLYDSGDIALPDNGGIEPNRDLVHVLPSPLDNVVRVRFTSSAIEDSNGEAGLSEFRIIGDGPIKAFAAVKQWSWEGGLDSLGVTVNGATETVPAVIDLNGDGIPEVIFNVTSGHLLALNGADGSPFFIVGGGGDPDRRVERYTAPAVGDIDNDGLPEIVIASNSSNYVKAFEHDGSLKWVSERLPYNIGNSATSIADLDGDGSPEIFAASGGQNRGVAALDASGNIVWVSESNGSGNNSYTGGIVVVADVDLDGSPDIVAGDTVYNADGTTKWHRDDLTDGYNAVANFDNDAFAEIVLVTGGEVHILEHDGQTKHFAEHAGLSRGGAPTVADFDSDGKPEIGIAGSSHYFVLEDDLTVKWRAPINDSSSRATGSTVFDFEGDGAAEVVYSDQDSLFIFRGTDGELLYETEARSPTRIEAPIVADVDNDGAAEIVAMASTDGSEQPAALFVLKAIDDNWVSTRPLWSQHTYHVTNINLDGSIPRYEQPNWLTPGLNSFRQNQFLPEERSDAVDSFTYKANDGISDSNVSTVYIDLLPVNTAPEFISTPIAKATAGYRYLYSAQAVDAEADAISFTLTSGPAGMSIDSQIGLVSWTPDLDDLGQHSVSLSVTDSLGFTSNQLYSISVVLPLIVPDIVGSNLPAANDEITMVTLALGNVASQFHPTVPKGLISGQRPQAGALAQMGDRVDVVLSLGQSNDPASDDNLPPVAVSDTYRATLDEQFEISADGVMGNDFDPDADPFTAELVTDAQRGSLTFNSDGSFNYLLNADIPTSNDTIELETHCETANADLVSNSQIAVGDVDGDGELELVGHHYINSNGHQEFWIIDAKTCGTEFLPTPGSPESIAILSAGGFSPDTKVGLLDIDGDGDLEIIGAICDFDTSNLVACDAGFGLDSHLAAFHHDGTPAWAGLGRSEALPVTLRTPSVWKDGGPVFADLDGDGTVEIVMPLVVRSAVSGQEQGGAAVFNAADGSLKWHYIGDDSDITRDRFTFANTSQPAIVADLDLDGTMEVIFDHWVMSHDGNLEFVLPTTISTIPGVLSVAIANFDNDPFPEILGRDQNRTFLFEHDGSLKWSRPNDITNHVHSVISVGDFDGDNEMEFAYITWVSSARAHLRMYETDGSLLWSHEGISEFEKNNGQARHNPPVAFDVNQDGADDLVVNYQVSGTNSTVYAFDGRDGTVLFSEAGFFEFGGDRQTPVIADLDGDGDAEIITSGHNGLSGGLKILSGKSTSPLPPAPPIHNQWMYNPAYTAIDASVPAIPVPHWLVPGLNGFRKIPTVFDVLKPLAVEDSFSYKVNDGTADSNTATVNLNVSPPMAPPEILSAAIAIATEDQLYQYAVFAVDPDLGDTLSYFLTAAPTGMTIDPAAGLIQWLPRSANIGDHQVTVVVSDTDSLADIQSYVLTVAPPTMVPNVVGLQLAVAQVDISAANLAPDDVFRVFNKDIAVDEVISQNPVAGLQVANGIEVDLVISKGPGPLDTDDDGDGQSENDGDCNDDDDTTFPGAVDSLGDNIDQNCDGVDGDIGTATIVIEPSSLQLLVGQSERLIAYAVFPDQSSINITDLGSWSSADAGIADINSDRLTAVSAGQTAIAIDHAGLSSAITIDVTGLEVDSVPPTAVISSPSGNQTITAPSEIVGTATDNNFFKYTLEIAPVGEDTFTEIASSAVPVTDGVLGQFDPTLLLNDLYVLRLSVMDTGGNVTAAERIYQVDENMKVGNFSLTFTDLEIPMSGIPITVNRTYDSRDKRRGDFGVGWRLDVQTLSCRANRVLGTGWEVIRSGLSFQLVPTDEHKVSITLPGGKVEEFDMVVSPTTSPLVPFPPSANRASFRARLGTLGSLQSLDNINLTILDSQPGEINLLDDSTNRTFNPQRFKYTQANGTEIILSKSRGVEKITETNGNTLEFRNDGIFHSAGKQALFVRDGLGRITRLIDPNGNEQVYVYDADANLSEHRDALMNNTVFSYNRDHGLIKIVDALGNSAVRNEYDDLGRLIATVDALGNRIEFVQNLGTRQQIVRDVIGNTEISNYDENGNVVSRETVVTIEGVPSVVRTTYTYDSQGNEASITNPDGVVSTFIYDENNNQTSAVTDSGGLNLTQTKEFNDKNQLTSQTDQAGAITNFTYSSAGNLIGVTDPLGNSNTFTYNQSGQLISKTDALGNQILSQFNSFGFRTHSETRDSNGNTVQMAEYVYDQNGNQTSQTEFSNFGGALESRTFTFVYDANNRRIETTDPAGNTTLSEYDALGNQIGTIDAFGNRTEFEYSDRGELLKTVFADLSVRESKFDTRGNRVKSIDPLGRETVMEYDELSRLVKTVNPDLSEADIVYSPAGNTVAKVDENGNRTEFIFDSAGRQVQTKLAAVEVNNSGVFENPIIRTGYNNAGQVVSVTDANGNVTRFEYDLASRLVKTTFADSSITETGYDPLNRISSTTNELGLITRNEYDGLGNLIKVIQPLPDLTSPTQPETSYRYDGYGNRLTQTDAEGNTTRFSFNQLDQQQNRILPEGQSEMVNLDRGLRASEVIDFNGNRILFQYDQLGRVVEREYMNGEKEIITYTLSGNTAAVSNSNGTVSYAYDVNDRLATVTSADGKNITYEYLPTGTILRTTIDSGRQIEYTCDSLNRVKTVNSAEGLARYGYDLNGNQTSLLHANGARTEQEFDSRNRIIKVQHFDAADVLIEAFEYDYDATGMRLTSTEMDGSVESYVYDQLNRVKSTTRSGSDPFTESFVYDLVGNRLESSTATTNTTYLYDNNDRLLSSSNTSYAYDARGNRIRETTNGVVTDYQWNLQNRLESVIENGVATSFQYDAIGNRINKSQTGVSSNYLVNPNDISGLPQIVQQYDDSGSPTIHFTHGTDLLNESDATSSESRFYHYDAHGSTRATTDQTAQADREFDFDTFGAERFTPSANDPEFSYSGEQTDRETKLQYLRARYYDPVSGVFLSQDPFLGDIQVPVTLHRYQYAGNNPVNFIDPTGEFTLAEINITSAIRSGLKLGRGQKVAKAFCTAKTTIGAVEGAVAVLQIGATAINLITNKFDFEIEQKVKLPGKSKGERNELTIKINPDIFGSRRRDGFEFAGSVEFIASNGLSLKIAKSKDGLFASGKGFFGFLELTACGASVAEIGIEVEATTGVGATSSKPSKIALSAKMEISAFENRKADGSNGKLQGFDSGGLSFKFAEFKR